MGPNLIKYKVHRVPIKILETRSVDYRNYLEDKIIEMLMDDSINNKCIYEGKIVRSDDLRQLIVAESICVATGRSSGSESVDIYVLIEDSEFYNLDRHEQDRIYDMYERINDVINITIKTLN